MDVDVDSFIRDGYVVVRGAFDADTAAACRKRIWDALARRGIAAPRMIAQPAVQVPDGFALDGSDPSPVARAIVAGLEAAEG